MLLWTWTDSRPATVLTLNTWRGFARKRGGRPGLEGRDTAGTVARVGVEGATRGGRDMAGVGAVILSDRTGVEVPVLGFEDFGGRPRFLTDGWEVGESSALRFMAMTLGFGARETSFGLSSCPFILEDFLSWSDLSDFDVRLADSSSDEPELSSDDESPDSELLDSITPCFFLTGLVLSSSSSSVFFFSLSDFGLLTLGFA